MFSFEVVLNYNRDTRASNKFLNDRDFKILPRHCVQISSLTLDDDYTTKPLLHKNYSCLTSYITQIFLSGNHDLQIRNYIGGGLIDGREKTF